jgi:glycosyltransferase involved in cell wall biosynthesis
MVMPVIEDENEYFLTILCSTYNHELYIRQCLDGFVMQKTNFNFLVIVHDDASIDGTQNIIREFELRYPNIIKPIYQKTNGYGSERNRRDKIERLKGKYVALCEGDDYWTDPYKLQKQVDFLEDNPEYTFCCHRFKILIDDDKRFIDEYAHKCYKDSLDLIINDNLFFKYWVTQPLTAIIKIEDFIAVNKEVARFSHNRDIHLFYYLLKRGKGISLNSFMGVYRRHSNGVTSIASLQEKCVVGLDIYRELYASEKNDIIRKYYLGFIFANLRYISQSLDNKFKLLRSGFLISKTINDFIIY